MHDFNKVLWKIIKWFFAILVILYVMSSLMDKSKEISKTPSKPLDNIGDEIKKPKASVIHSEPKLTSTELLIKAKKLLYNNNFNEAIDTLNKIELGSKEFPEAQKLLTRINKQLKAYDENNRSDDRKAYAKLLENNLLDNAKMDTTITTSGKDYTILKIKYILMSRVLVNELTKDGKLPSLWEQMGFKTIIFTDGHYRTWTMNLKGKNWK